MDIVSNQTTDAGAEVNDLTNEGGAEGSQESNGEGLQQYTPFSTGKEKFSIDGEEVEMDWDEVKKSVQLAKASYKRFEEANGIKQSAEKAYSQLMQLAKTNPEGLLRVLNPNWQAGTPAQGTHDQGQRTTDQEQPWQSEFEKLSHENKTLAQKLEQIELDKERAALQGEFQQVESNYPVFKDKLAMNYLKTEYRKALKSGMDVSLEDVAFYVNQDITKSKTAQIQSTKQKLEQKRASAPISAQPSGGNGKKNTESFEDLRKSLGLA